jgi:hypothetical protein
VLPGCLLEGAFQFLLFGDVGRKRVGFGPAVFRAGVLNHGSAVHCASVGHSLREEAHPGGDSSLARLLPAARHDDANQQQGEEDGAEGHQSNQQNWNKRVLTGDCIVNNSPFRLTWQLSPVYQWKHSHKIWSFSLE